MTGRRFSWGDGLLVVWALLWLLPLAWTVRTSFIPADQVFARGFHFTLANYRAAWAAAPFAKYFVNTLVIVFGILAVQLVTITLAGYAVARMRFRGRDLFFLLFLLQIMVPVSALIYPNYLTIRSLGLINTRLAIMLPYFASAFGTFLMRQTFLGVPRELEEAAVVDGAGRMRVLWHVYIPAARPSLLAFALVSVSFHWNDFLWPLIVTNTSASRPLTVGLALLTQMSQTGAQWGLVTAGTLLVVAPLLLAFMALQRQFVNSFVRSGIR